MRFIVDAQLPRSLSLLINQLGYDSIHTMDMESKNATSDVIIYRFSVDDNRTVISKDSDFIHSHLLLNKPEKLIMVKTGNIKNHELLNLFENNLAKMIDMLAEHSIIEIHKYQIILHT